MANFATFVCKTLTSSPQKMDGFNFRPAQYCINKMVCGLGRENEDYACVWCKCPGEQRWDTSKTWSINDPKFGARTVAEIARFSTGKKLNCKAQPLFDFIPMDHRYITSFSEDFRCFD